MGTQQQVLIEGPDKTGLHFTGRTPSNRVVILDADPRLVGEIVTVDISRATVSTLYGELVLEGVAG